MSEIDLDDDGMPETGKLLLDEPPLQVLPRLARAIGVNEAMMLQQVHYWLQRSEYQHDGRKWFYKTIEDWVEELQFMSESTVKRTIQTLRDTGLLLVEQFNAAKRDHRNWYSLNYKTLRDIKRSLPPRRRVKAKDPTEAAVPSFLPVSADKVKVTPSPRSGQNEPIDQVKMTSSRSVQNDLFDQANLTPSSNEQEITYSETTKEQQQQRAESKPENAAVVSLEAIGIEKHDIKRIMSDYSVERIEEVLRWVDERQKRQETIINPAGFVRAALEQGWTIPTVTSPAKAIAQTAADQEKARRKTEEAAVQEQWNGIKRTYSTIPPDKIEELVAKVIEQYEGNTPALMGFKRAKNDPTKDRILMAGVVDLWIKRKQG